MSNFIDVDIEGLIEKYVPMAIMSIGTGGSILHIILALLSVICVNILIKMINKYKTPKIMLDTRAQIRLTDKRTNLNGILKFITNTYPKFVKEYLFLYVTKDPYCLENSHLNSRYYKPVTSPSSEFLIDIDIDNDEIIEKISKRLKIPENFNIESLLHEIFTLKVEYLTNDIEENGKVVTKREKIITIYNEDQRKIHLLLELLLMYEENADVDFRLYQTSHYVSSSGNLTDTWGYIDVPKTIDTTFLSEKNKNIILSSYNDWIDGKQKYIDQGRPYKLCYLLHGKPGCGKTSLIISMARLSQKNIKRIELKGMKNESLLELFTTISNCVVLFEDIDAHDFTLRRELRKTRDNDFFSPGTGSPSMGDNVTLDKLLDILDGNMYLNNCIIFITTNHLEQLDPALIRAGRVDFMVEFEYADEYQFSDIYKYHYKRNYKVDDPTFVFENHLLSTSSLLNEYIFRYDHKTMLETIKSDFVKIKERKETEDITNNVKQETLLDSVINFNRPSILSLIDPETGKVYAVSKKIEWIDKKEKKEDDSDDD